jgi:hypothetical protein
VCDANAAGVASNTSAVVTMPSDLPRVRAKYSPISSTRGLSKLSEPSSDAVGTVSSGNTRCWSLLLLLPVD